jgi:hypothetical protein
VDVTVSLPAAIGAIGLNPYLVLCLFAPVPTGCPSGVPATFEVDVGDLAGLLTGPDIEVLGVDSDQPNAAFVYFRIEPPGPANVRFWEADGTPAVVREASWIAELDLPSGHTFMARLDVLASTTYRYQVVAGDGIVAAVSPLGEFTTATGVSLFDIETALIGSPVLGLESGLSPYTRLALGGLARPLELTGAGDGCAVSADFGGVNYCLPDSGPLGGPPPDECRQATVRYALDGIAADGVLVRAFPTVDGVLVGGGMTLRGVLEAEGPAGDGTLVLGCLAEGLDYTIAIDAIGDDRGPLATELVTR